MEEHVPKREEGDGFCMHYDFGSAETTDVSSLEEEESIPVQLSLLAEEEKGEEFLSVIWYTSYLFVSFAPTGEI
ncbi:MAG TPA: hypothetical protein VGN34_25200 [Ktedonobacteraceae bacterium]